MSREMSKEEKKLSVAQVQREMQTEKNRVRDKAGKTKLPLNLIWRKYVPLKFKLERYERLQAMAEMALNSEAYKIGSPAFLTDCFYEAFGTIVVSDWLFEGTALNPYRRTNLTNPGTFVAKLDGIRRVRALYFGQLEKVLKQPGSAQLRAWLKKRDTYYDVYGRPKIK
jgi:hypothetical protein